MRLNFLLSTSVGLALALGPIAANAQTYDAVKRKAREVNAPLIYAAISAKCSDDGQSEHF